MCRRGNDSQIVVQKLKKYLNEGELNQDNIECIKDIIGGIQAWANNIDPNFPKY